MNLSLFPDNPSVSPHKKGGVEEPPSLFLDSGEEDTDPIFRTPVRELSRRIPVKPGPTPAVAATLRPPQPHLGENNG